jgi:cytochrome c
MRDSFWARLKLKAVRVAWLCSTILLLVLIAGQAIADKNAERQRVLPGAGTALNSDALAALPRHVWPNGAGLPAGHGDSQQGQIIYDDECAACHGPQGEGASAIELVGERDSLATPYPDRGIAVYWPYAPTLFEYVKRAMPPAKPYSLSDDQTYSVIAYLLVLNGLLDDGARLDAAVLASIVMPNVDGFIDQYPNE